MSIISAFFLTTVLFSLVTTVYEEGVAVKLEKNTSKKYNTKVCLEIKKDYNVRKYWTRIAIENKMEVVYEQQKR